MKKIIALCSLIIAGITLTNCTNDNNDNIDKDITSPIITIQSPNLNQLYLTNAGSGPQTAILAAEANDETRIESISLSVTNGDGTIVFQQIEENNSDTETSLSISREFETTNPGIYNVIFTAIDTEGSLRVSNPRTFIYQ